MKEQIPVGFTYTFELLKDDVVIDEWEVKNVVPLQGINYIASAVFGDVAPIGSFYISAFTNNYLPTLSSVAADFPSDMGEFTGYSEPTRPVWARANADGVISNETSRAVMTVTASARLYGGVLLSVAAKGSASGTLLSVARFPSPRDVEAGMVLRVRADISFIPTSVV